MEITMKLKAKLIRIFAILLPILLPLTSCSNTSGEVKTDSTLTNQRKALEQESREYKGPRYILGILEFQNRTSVKTLADKSADILRTLLSNSGFEVITLSKDDLKQQERLMKLQLSGQIKSNSKDYSSGFSEIDYRIAGAVTSYNETEEASNVILAQTKIQKARVEVTYALVNPVTGKTLVSKSGYGEYKKETGGILGLGSSSSGDLSLREGALRDALNKATTEILKEIKKLPYSAKIVEVQDDMLYIKIGAKSNIPVGSKLKVYKIGRAIKDSSTGEHLGFVRSSIGEVTISQHINENISIAPMKALSDIKPGDQVELIK